MVADDRVRQAFADARLMHGEALARLEAGDIRDAAEKAWCATKRTTDALILARRGGAPTTTAQTSAGIRSLGQESEALALLRSHYTNVVHHLHSDCFYDGHCEPADFIESLILATGQYIRDAEGLA